MSDTDRDELDPLGIDQGFIRAATIMCIIGLMVLAYLAGRLS